MPTAKIRCDVLGKQHRWQERKERYSSWSTQAVGSYSVCLTCRARSEEKPPEGPRRARELFEYEDARQCPQPRPRIDTRRQRDEART